jgi:hypothetical protein
MYIGVGTLVTILGSMRRRANRSCCGARATSRGDGNVQSRVHLTRSATPRRVRGEFDVGYGDLRL